MISSRRVYASFVRTSVRFTFAAAIVSGLPLNVPTCSSSPAITMRIASSVPPIAPHGQTRAQRLRERDEVGLHAERLDRAAPAPP